MAEKNHVGEFLERVYPEHGKLQVDDKGGLFTTIVDADMDGVVVKFNFDDCAHIETEDLTYVCFDSNTLIMLGKLVREAEEIYNNRTQKEWDSFPD